MQIPKNLNYYTADIFFQWMMCHTFVLIPLMVIENIFNRKEKHNLWDSKNDKSKINSSNAYCSNPWMFMYDE